MRFRGAGHGLEFLDFPIPEGHANRPLGNVGCLMDRAKNLITARFHLYVGIGSAPLVRLAHYMLGSSERGRAPEAAMNVQRELLLPTVLSVTAATPAVGQTTAPAIPDFSGSWNHASLNGLELPRSGPGPVRNRSRRLTGPQAGVGNGTQLVGDYTNPILQPWAAEVVRKFGEISLAGKGYPTPRNQCWPEQVPFVFANYGMQVIQQPDKVTILYPFDHQFRQVRLNQRHPVQVSPSWYGDSVGHYEGDTLVVDTRGIKIGPFSMIDWYGTPFTKALHVEERYRLIDYDDMMEAIARDATENFQFANPDNGPAVDLNYKGKGLQIQVIVDDEGAFTMPWSATVTLRRALDERLELVCADNILWYPGMHSAVPMADKLDF
jgi:hypothetical protein